MKYLVKIMALSVLMIACSITAAEKFTDIRKARIALDEGLSQCRRGVLDDACKRMLSASAYLYSRNDSYMQKMERQIIAQTGFNPADVKGGADTFFAEYERKQQAEAQRIAADRHAAQQREQQIEAQRQAIERISREEAYNQGRQIQYEYDREWTEGKDRQLYEAQQREQANAARENELRQQLEVAQMRGVQEAQQREQANAARENELRRQLGVAQRSVDLLRKKAEKTRSAATATSGSQEIPDSSMYELSIASSSQQPPIKDDRAVRRARQLQAAQQRQNQPQISSSETTTTASSVQQSERPVSPVRSRRSSISKRSQSPIRQSVPSSSSQVMPETTTTTSSIVRPSSPQVVQHSQATGPQQAGVQLSQEAINAILNLYGYANFLTLDQLNQYLPALYPYSVDQLMTLDENFKDMLIEINKKTQQLLGGLDGEAEEYLNTKALNAFHVLTKFVMNVKKQLKKLKK